MVLPIFFQLNILIFSIVAGIITGILFDIYRFIRGFENINRIIIYIEDILFWILTAIIIFIFLLYTNQAFIGVYVYISLLIGILIYLKIVSKFFLIFEQKMFEGLGMMCRLCKNIISYPFYLLIDNIQKKKKNSWRNIKINLKYIYMLFIKFS